MLVSPDYYILPEHSEGKFCIICGLQARKLQFSVFPTNVEMAQSRPSSLQRRISGHAPPPELRGDAMCPFCLASMGLIVAGATSAGGLTALAGRLSRKKNNAKGIPSSSQKTKEK